MLVFGDQLLAIASEQYVVAEPAERLRARVEFGQGNGLVLPELVAVDETAGDFAALERVGRRWEQKFATIERDEATVGTLWRRRARRFVAGRLRIAGAYRRVLTPPVSANSGFVSPW